MIQGLENTPHDVRLKGAQLTQLIEKTIEKRLDLSLKGLVRFADKGMAISTEARQMQSWKYSFLAMIMIKHWSGLQGRGKEQMLILAF